MEPKRTEFNLVDFPINTGFYAIEAGAGSGKTYNLVRIVLRLLCRTSNPVSINKILLVTFTEAAAMEMRQRLREILEECLVDKSLELRNILDEGLGFKVNKRRISKALDFLGSMQITTIHGFCLRAYNDHAVNAGFSPLPGDPIDGSDLVEEIANDYIRANSDQLSELKSINHCIKALFSNIETKIPEKFTDLKEFVTKKIDQGEVITFDHLITRLRDALNDSNLRKSVELAKFIRADYQACLIDESQDTDGLQWDIFNTLFGPKSNSTEHLLVMVGDPKQSIFGFRGADVNSYLRARREAQSIFTLSENFRSSQRIIEAFNKFFLSDKFFSDKSDNITCDEVRVPKSKPALPELEGFPIEIIYSKENKQVGLDAIRLLNELDKAGINKKGEKRPGDSADVAILTRSNSEAEKIYRALMSLGVGSSLESGKSVFQTTTAFQAQLLLRATLKPANTGNRKALLLSRPALFGPDVNLESELDNKLSAWLDDALTKWTKYGFPAVWQHLTRTAPANLQSVVESLAQSNFRNRSLMDLSHIGELLTTRTRQNHWSPQQTFDHLSARLKGDDESGTGESDDNEQDASDEEALRLDTPNARIMVRTIHKSKGLEYNAVIIHNCFNSSNIGQSSNGKIIRPDASSGSTGTPRIYFKDKNSPRKNKKNDKGPDQVAFETQEREENARLLYVAMTRARQRLVLMGDGEPIDEESLIKFPAVFHAAGFDSLLKQNELRKNLKNLAGYPSSTTEYRITIPHSKSFKPKLLDSPNFLNRSKGSTSYSGISHGDSTGPKRPGGDQPEVETGGDNNRKDSFEQLLPDGLKGSLLGIFIHEILESLDFKTSASNPDLEKIIEGKFRQAGLLPRNHQEESSATARIAKSIPMWVSQSLRAHTQIHSNAKVFSLKDIKAQKQISEVRFAYAANINKKIIEEITQAFKIEFNNTPLSELNIEWDEVPLKGIIRGAIDFIFEHDGRYYIIDWKTNFLGKSQEHYEQPKLAENISKEKYHLQFSLYTLALDAHLRSRLGANWNYERDFGGVYYLYLRGFGAVPNADIGVFYHRPSLKFIQTISQYLKPSPV